MNQHKNEKIFIGIIGGGKISEQHLKALKCLQCVNVVGICDLSPVLAEFTAERFEIENWYTDYKEMLEEQKTDFVHVLTPPATHERIVRDCIEAGCNVIVEKPIALNNAVLRELHEFAVSRNVKIIENHNYRFNKPILQIEETVNDGRLGEVKEVEIRMGLNIRGGGRYSDLNMPHPSHKLPAGVIHEFITHLVYLLLHFMPEGSIDNIDIIRSAWRNHGGGSLYKYDDLDAMVVANDVHGHLRFSCNQWPDCFSVCVRGTEGTVSAELYNPVYLETIPRKGGKNLTPLVNAYKSARNMRKSGVESIWGKVKNIGAYDGLYRHLELIYASIESGIAFPVTFKQMDEASRMIDMLLAPENAI